VLDYAALESGPFLDSRPEVDRVNSGGRVAFGLTG
jgi:hypothetical protein